MATNVTVNGSQVSITTTAGDAKRQTTTDAGASPLDNLTLAQALAWIDTNVNNLADAKAAFRHLTKLVFVLRAELRRQRTLNDG
jgi:hypothetical protein